MASLSLTAQRALAGMKRLLLLRGLDVHFVRSKYAWLKQHHIQTIFDVGANIGSFSTIVHMVLPDATIYAFEPLRECYEQMVKRLHRVSSFHGFNMALGEEEGQAPIWQSSFDQASSLLPMGDLHMEAFPSTARFTREQVEVRTLDAMAHRLDISDNILVKLDVQGFEDRVIAGGRKVIERAHILIVETSFRELYRGQKLFGEIYTLLRDLGFSYHGCVGQVVDPRDGSALQADSVFLKSGA
ncbi:MAG TPA: FkbM family methyltransferase [Phycisphaerae bacterium]|nr:FkbM family methyltransferase [Phycisphaerae bacterium]